MPCIAWKMCWIKIYLHESDTVPWLVNKILSKLADKVFVGFSSSKKYFKNKNIKIVGQLLSNSFFCNKSENKKQISNNKTNMLVIWWSWWAKILINAIKTFLDKWKLTYFNIFIIWWLLNKENIFKNYNNISFYWFISQEKLVKLYKKSDISITRGSATSLAEQDQFDIKKIIVPLPYTWWNHQYYNALEYKKKWDNYLSQKDDDFLEKLEKEINFFIWYKKQKNRYRKEKDGRNIVLKEIL